MCTQILKILSGNQKNADNYLLKEFCNDCENNGWLGSSWGMEQVYFEPWTTGKKISKQSYEFVCNYYCVVKRRLLSIPKAFPVSPGNGGSFNMHANVMKQRTCSR